MARPTTGGADQVVRALLRAIADRDADTAADVTTLDVVFEPASTEVAVREPYHGHDGLRAYLADLERTWDEFDVSVSEVRAGERYLVALGRVYARAGGVIADGPVAFVFELREGLVCWGKTFTDRSAALRHAELG